jgi:hypothetical protein
MCELLIVPLRECYSTESLSGAYPIFNCSEGDGGWDTSGARHEHVKSRVGEVFLPLRKRMDDGEVKREEER